MILNGLNTQMRAVTLPSISKDADLIKDETYLKIIDLMGKLWADGVIQRGHGYCLSMSDMMKTLLEDQGIPCKIVECSLIIMRKDPPGIMIIGQDRQSNDPSKELDTHVVCVTETDQPILIDCSIGHVWPSVPYVIERVNGQGNEIAHYNFEGVTWVYKSKLNPRLPNIMQQNIIERLLTERKVKKDISLLKLLIIFALTISSFNAVRGAYDFYQVYIDETNYWGPAHIKQLHNRLEHMEQQLALPPEQRKTLPPQQTNQ